MPGLQDRTPGRQASRHDGQDLPGIERHVDFPSLRTSLKDQLKVKLSEEITRHSGGDLLSTSVWVPSAMRWQYQ
jgi:hypothetical protein